MLVKMPDALAGEMLSKTPGRVAPVPTPGQHTDEILSGLLGDDRARLDGLRGVGVIA